jgi:mono/diheme cytochrome c family protein
LHQPGRSPAKVLQEQLGRAIQRALIADIGGELMLRLGLLCLMLSGFFDAAMADSALERGDYLVNTILACGNCHTPRDDNGAIIKDKALSGGRVFSTPAFIVTTSNITPDVETGIGSWTDAEIKRALIEGVRPDHHRLPGVPLAAIMPANFYKALLPEDLDAIIAYLHSVKPVHNEISDPVYKAPIHRDPYPDGRTDLTNPCSTIRSGVAPISPPSAIAWNATRHGRAAYPTSKPDWAMAAGSLLKLEVQEAQPPTSLRIAQPASEGGATRRLPARSRRAYPATSGCSSRRWPFLSMPG